jgi:7-carboxy-7-deazaguanine synthase
VTTTTATELVVSEVFGPTVQGEGPSTGRRAVFIRLGLCNLDCSWCDTPYTWDWTGKNGPPQDKGALRKIEVTHLARTAANALQGSGMVVITGGEPLVQRTKLEALVAHLHVAGVPVEIETNGTLHPGALDRWDPRYNVSPKLAHSGVPRDNAWHPDVLRAYVETERASFKVVVQQERDLDELAMLQHAAGIPNRMVWVMPEGRTPQVVDDRLRQLADLAIARGYNVSSRLHVALWGDQRGR